MPSKFEMVLFPILTKAALVGAAGAIGVTYLTARSPAPAAPFEDVPSPDGQYAAQIEHKSELNLSPRWAHGHIYTLAQGENRIASVRWLTPRHLEVLFIPGDPRDPAGANELPRQRTQFRDVVVSYRLSNEAYAVR